MFDIFKQFVNRLNNGKKEISEPILSLLELMNTKPSWFKRKYQFVYTGYARHLLIYNGTSLDITEEGLLLRPSTLFTKDECLLIQAAFYANRDKRLTIVRLYMRSRLEKKLKETLLTINGDI